MSNVVARAHAKSKCRPLGLRTVNPKPTVKVLCVDDDPDISRNLELRLREYGADVRVAYFGMQAVSIAVQEVPDLVLIDLAMPYGDGRFVLELLKNNSKTNHIPVIVLTGLRDPSLRKKMIELGADQFLTKPVHFDDLLHEMSRFISLHD